MAGRVKEDERNERVIRGLLKLPENRRCINCNSLVCFYWLWVFVVALLLIWKFSICLNLWILLLNWHFTCFFASWYLIYCFCWLFWRIDSSLGWLTIVWVYLWGNELLWENKFIKLVFWYWCGNVIVGFRRILLISLFFFFIAFDEFCCCASYVWWIWLLHYNSNAKDKSD